VWEIQPLKNNQRVFKVAKELTLRVQHLQARALEILARDALQRLQEGADAMDASYASRLSLARTKFRPGEAFAIVLRGEPLRKRLLELDTASQVVYVRPRKGQPPSKVIDILRQYSPWPTDVLPVQPPRGAARVVYRTVTRDEVAGVRRLRAADATAWRTALSQAGVRLPMPRPSEGLRVVEDLAFQVLRMEFGSKATQARPLWLPTLRTVRSRVRQLWRRREFHRALTDSTFYKWQRWPGKMVLVPLRSVQRYRLFQRRLLRRP